MQSLPWVNWVTCFAPSISWMCRFNHLISSLILIDPLLRQGVVHLVQLFIREATNIRKNTNIMTISLDPPLTDNDIKAWLRGSALRAVKPARGRNLVLLV